jgi:hypothetical protein
MNHKVFHHVLITCIMLITGSDDLFHGPAGMESERRFRKNGGWPAPIFPFPFSIRK